MPRCKCGNYVAWNTPYCMCCGRSKPGILPLPVAALEKLLLAGQIGTFGTMILVFLFMAPFAIFTWLFNLGEQDPPGIKQAIKDSFHNGWAWLGSAIFWSVVISVIFVCRKVICRKVKRTGSPHSAAQPTASSTSQMTDGEKDIPD